MNESYSDLQDINGFATNVEVMPFFYSLKENTVKGFTYASIYGGNTANSEFEFLTSSSMYLFPDGYVPYADYIKGELPNLVTWLEELGYNTYGTHPAREGNWNRGHVYPNLGFDYVYFEEDYGECDTIRELVTDRADYQKLIKDYEDRDKNKPFFYFNVTIQNHGGYEMTIEENIEKVSIVGHEGKYAATENYLTLMRESDKAFRELVEYFEKQDKDVIILLFGDHQPTLKDGFYDILYPDDEKWQEKYKVPFLIWANFDIEEKEDLITSNNYLAGILLQVAGIPQSVYTKQVGTLAEEYPVITGKGYMDKEYNWKEWQKQDNMPKELLEYNYKMYNYILDQADTTVRDTMW